MTDRILFIDTGSLSRLGKAGLLDTLLPSNNGGRTLVVTAETAAEIALDGGAGGAAAVNWLMANSGSYIATAPIPIDQLDRIQKGGGLGPADADFAERSFQFYMSGKTNGILRGQYTYSRLSIEIVHINTE
jgi:hypothetical protein